MLDKPLERRPFRVFAVGGVLLAVTLAWWNALGAGMLFDSATIILEDLRLREFTGANLQAVFLDDYWYTQDSDLYRPLTTLSYLVNYSLLGSGPHAAGYVAVNLALHTLNALLVIALLRALRLARGVALLAGLGFALHPLHTEAVTNVVGRADLLAALGVLGGLWFHLRATRGAEWRLGPAAGLALCSALAVGSKESGVVLIGVVVLHDLLFTRPEGVSGFSRIARRQVVRSYLPVLAPVGLWFALRSAALADQVHGAAPVDNPLLLAEGLPALFTACGVLVRYLGLLLWPGSLSADYSFNAIPVGIGALEVAAAVLLLAALAAALRLRRRAPTAAFAILLFFVAIAPVANVFFRTGTIMAERLMYLPGVGLIALVAWALVSGLSRRSHRLAGVVILLVLAGLGARTFLRNRDWRSGVTLFQAAVQTCPTSFKAHQALAAALYEEVGSDPARNRERIDTIVHHAERAWAILQRLPPRVGYTDLLAELGNYYHVKAQLATDDARPWLNRAREIYRRAIGFRQAPDRGHRWRLHQGLAEVNFDLGRLEEALTAYRTAVEMAPGPRVLGPFAVLCYSAGRHPEALRYALRLLTLRPEDEGMIRLVRDHYARRLPGVETVSPPGGPARFNTGHPTVRSDLHAAIRAQYRALLAAGLTQEAREYRRRMRTALGLDPTTGGK